MPQHKDLKRLVRARMDETGLNYTQALTALLSETRLDRLPDGAAYEGRRVIELRFRGADPPGGFGTVMQSIGAARYRGRRVRFGAVIRGREIARWAGLWLRVDAPGGTRVLDNMRDRPLSGSSDWTEAASVLDVAEDAVSVHFGVLLAGSGAVHLAGPRFDVVQADVPVTRLAGVALAAEPRGLDFGPA